MAECCKCKEEVSRFTSLYTTHNGKIYCRKHYNEVTAKDMEKKKKEKHDRDAKRAILDAYDTNARNFIIDLIKDWKPRNCKKETDYTKSLKKFLDRELSPVDIYVGKESGLESSRLDLVVSKKKPYREFAIELKYNLHKSTDFDRLKGQIHTYIAARFKHIIIWLVGNTTHKLDTELNKYNKEMLAHYRTYFGLDTIDVVKKKWINISW